MNKIKLKELHHGRILYVVECETTLIEVHLIDKPRIDEWGNLVVEVGYENVIQDDLNISFCGWGEWDIHDFGINRKESNKFYSLDGYKAFKKLKHAKKYMEWLKLNPKSKEKYNELLRIREENSKIPHDPVDYNSGLEMMNFGVDGGKRCFYMVGNVCENCDLWKKENKKHTGFTGGGFCKKHELVTEYNFKCEFWESNDV